MSRKNQARLFYRESTFIIWQDENFNWWFSLEDLPPMSTGSKHLQTALNVVYETIDDRFGTPHRKRAPRKRAK